MDVSKILLRVTLLLVLWAGCTLCQPTFYTCETYQCPPLSTCVEYETFVSCECPPGKTGENCTIDDPCLETTFSSNCTFGRCFGPCNPNVVCNGATGLPQCAGCLPGWTNETCDTDINECIEYPGECNNGDCKNLEGDFECICNTGWTGKLCNCKKGTKCDTEQGEDTAHEIQSGDKGNNTATAVATNVMLIATTCLLGLA